MMRHVATLQLTITDLMVDDIDGGDFEMTIQADKAKSGVKGAEAKDLIEKVWFALFSVCS